MPAQAVAFPDYSVYPIPRLLEAYEAGPERLRRAIDGLSEEQLRTRSRGDETWSAHEIVLHVADSELVGAVRFRKVLAEPIGILPGYDQDLWAKHLAYRDRDSAEREAALALFAALRRGVAAKLARATPDDWQRCGLHPDYGPLTLRNLLELYADHAERHVEQILAIRERLGRALPLPSLLPRRLY